jgi:tol-pal system protein YbgF
MKRKIVLAAVAFFALTAVSASQAKKGHDEETNGTEVLGGDLAVTVSNHARSISTMTNQVNEVVSKIQTIDGDVAKNDRKDMDQDKVLKDSQLRLQTLEDRISMLTGQLQELKSEGLLKPTASQRLDEFRSYSKALEHVNARNYKQAVTELQAYQSANKKSVFSDYAQYWIAESYYLQSDYEMAIAEYQRLLAKDSKSVKAPAALYKQGLSFFYLQSFEDAKEFLGKVIRNYPQSIEAVQASSQIARINTILDLRKKQLEEQQAVEQSM